MKQKDVSSDNIDSDPITNAESNFFITAFSKLVIKFKWLILAAILLFTAFTIPGLFRLNVTVNIEDFFLDGDPILENQQRFRKLFKNNDFVGVLVENEDVFSRESLELIHNVSSQLQKEVPLAKEVVSIINFKHPLMDKIVLNFKNGKLVSSDRVLNRFKSYYTKMKPLKGLLFSKDNKQAWIHLKLYPYPTKNELKGETEPVFAVGKKAYDIVKSITPGNGRLTATGVPVYAHRKETEMLNDLAVVLGIGALAALLLTILIFKSIQGVAGTLLVITFSVVSVFGIQGWMGITIDSAFLSVPILLAVGVSIGYTVHISRFFILNFRKTGDRKASVIYGQIKCAKPILFTAFTTIVALISFVFVQIKPIQWVGLTSALCIFTVYIFSMILFPIILSFGKDSESRTEETPKNDFMVPVLQLFSKWVGKHNFIILLIFSIITVISFWGISFLEVDFNAEKMTGTRLQHMKDQIHIGNSQIASSDTLDLVLVLPEKSLSKPQNLKSIIKLEEQIRKLPLVKRTKSIAGIVKEFNFLYNHQNDNFNKIPKQAWILDMLFEFLGNEHPEFLNSWAVNNLSTARIFIELNDFSSKKIEKNIEDIEKQISDIFPPSTQYFFSGSTYQMAVMNQYITRGLIQSILTALAMITILMMIVFKSIKLGLVAMIPNVFPVLIAGAIMGFLNIPLEFVTMTVAPMIMGLAVDDTIHLIWHLKEELKESDDFAGSVNRTFSVVGTAITETTIILCITFLIFTFSKVNSIIYMGLFTCIGILAAYLADIFVTPIIIKKIKYS